MATTSDIKIKDEYTSLVRPLTKFEYERLKESIKEANGLDYAVVVNKDNVVLDGHHRFRACLELGIAPKIEVKEFATPLDEKLFVIRSNKDRRQLNGFQLIGLGLKRKSILEEQAKKNMSDAAKGVKNFTPLDRVNLKIAKDVGKSHMTVAKVETILERGTPEQIQKLEQGKTTIDREYKQIRKAEKRQELIKNAKENSTLELPDSCELLYGDFREKLKDIPDNSIDFIFTDPPYKKQDLHIYKDLAVFAARVLKPGKSLVLYTGGYEIPEVIDYLRNAGLKYWFYVFVKHTGGLSRLWDKGVTADGKILLWFVKGDRPEYHEPIRNFVEFTPPDKSVNNWSQSITGAEYILSHLTVENQVVLDPFLGSGTIAIAALNLNRKIIGTEIRKDILNMAKSKIAEFLSSKTSSTKDRNKIVTEFMEENKLDEAIHAMLSEI